MARIAALALAAVALTAAEAGAQTAPKGIDVSHWQGSIGWLQVGAAGYDFAFAKATEGTTYRDPTHATNRSGAAAAGMRFGAYHFARPTAGSEAAAVASAVAQADHLVGYAQPRRGDLLPVLDLEKNGGLTPARLSTWSEAWLEHVHARLGVRPLVYASPSFWKTSLGDTPVFAQNGNRLWIAHWTKAALPILPAGGWGGQGWTFWQWTDCSRVPGIGGCVDGDRFNGSALTPVVVPALPAGLPVASSPPLVIGTPQAGRLLATTAGSWDGGKPVSFTYAWQRCDAAGAGCSPIAGAAKPTYTPSADDVGHALAVTVTAQSAAGTVSTTSAATVAVASSGAAPAAAPRATSPPAIEGTAQAGQTLTARVGTWTGSPAAFAYGWRRCAADGTNCVAIAGASGATRVLMPDDIGATLSVVVTATGTGGSRSAASAVSAVVAPAPLPAPAVGSAVALAGQAGAVVSADGRATVTWQPGALPAGATVRLAVSPSRLALPRSGYALAFGAALPLRYPVDVQLAAAPADAVPGLLPGRGVYRPVTALTAPMLPARQETGAYRDAAGALHVLTRRPGRLALFSPGRWGDPRFVPGPRPRLTHLSTLVVGRPRAGALLLRTRVTLDSQARLAVTVLTPRGRRLVLLARGSRIGPFLRGGATTTLKVVQLRPGALPVRVRVRATGLRPGTAYRLRVVATDPYRRRAQLTVRFSLRR